MVTNNAANNVTATTGKVLQGAGVGVASTFSTATYPSTATGTGTLLRADGTNWTVTTSTYPTTNAVSTLLYASASNVMSALATANRGVLVTSSAGVPSILASPAATGRVLLSNVSAAPSFSTAVYPSTAGISGNVLTSNGTDWSSSAPTGLASIGIQAFINAAQTNVTGDGTALTVNWTNSSWVSGGSNMTAGVFTVPSGGAGKYLIAYGITLDNLSASFTSGEFKIEGSLGTASRKVFNPAAGRTSGNQYQVTDQMIIDLGVGNTIYVTASVSGGTKTVGFTGESFGQFGYVSIARIFT